MGTIDIGVGEAVRVAEAEVDMRLGGKVEYRVDIVALEAVDHLTRVRDIAVVETKVGLVVEGPRVIEGRAVVELIERDDIVGARVCDC